MDEPYIQKDGEPMSEPKPREMVVARELDYKIKDYSHSTYQLTQIFPQNGIISPYTITQSGGADTIFQIPIATYNFSQSIFNFTLTPNLNADAAPALTTTWVYIDGITPIRQLQLYDDQGRFYCDLYDVGNFTNMIFRYTIKYEDLQTTDQIQVLDPSSTTADSGNGALPLGGVSNGMNYNVTKTAANVGSASTFTIGAAEGLNPNNSTTSPPYRTVGSQFVLNALVGSNGSPVTTTTLGDDINEPMYVLGKNLANVGQNTQGGGKFYMPVVNFKIPLKRLQGTIFSLDKSLYIGKVLYIRVVWQSSTKVLYYNDGTAANSANPGYLANSVPTQSNTGYQLSNLYIYLAKETNIIVENSLKKKINSPDGFKVMIPWISQYKQSQNTNSQSVTMRITSAYGKRLLRIWWAPYNQLESTIYAYDHCVLPTDQCTVTPPNANSIVASNPPAYQKVSSFYTLVNNERTSQYNYNVNNGSVSGTFMSNSFNDDYEARKNKLKGSCILSRNEYYYNWVWCEDFTDNVPMVEKPLHPDENTYLDGLDLTKGEVKYDIYVVQNGTPVPVNYYVYISTLKELTINSGGITLV